MNAEKTTKAYGYCRVSTVDQITGTSLESQQERITAIAKLHGYDLVEIFVEGGVSGKTPLKQREEGKKLLEQVQDGDVIIASKMDRLFRSLSDAVAMSKKWQDRGIKFILGDISSDPLDNGMGRLFFNIMGAIAEFERERILERTKEGREKRKQNNEFLGGREPLGKKVVEVEGKKVLQDKYSFNLEHEILIFRDLGCSLTEIRDQIQKGFNVLISKSTIHRCLTKLDGKDKQEDNIQRFKEVS